MLVSPAWIGCENTKRHSLSELLSDVVSQGRPMGNILLRLVKQINTPDTIKSNT